MNNHFNELRSGRASDELCNRTSFVPDEHLMSAGLTHIERVLITADNIDIGYDRHSATSDTTGIR